ncbi:hypothetical protein [Vannielia litorea]|uniref:hypothetical protein n=1 Tax=Vannielia litorea TaxID=1217970 RepID=UPI001C93C6ED|nr:hypothetical protein [Vannielia litorea]MBY6047344.1 hypothetical protein [Vannielia litorea]MBY6074758.1 hypothetical protein [Vannielia litorea]
MTLRTARTLTLALLCAPLLAAPALAALECTAEQVCNANGACEAAGLSDDFKLERNGRGLAIVYPERIVTKQSRSHTDDVPGGRVQAGPRIREKGRAYRVEPVPGARGSYIANTGRGGDALLLSVGRGSFILTTQGSDRSRPEARMVTGRCAGRL